MTWLCETCGAEDTIESDGTLLRCIDCGATPQDAPNRQRQASIASGRLLDLIVRTRFRSPGTSADAYTDALILWVSVIAEVRKALEPLDVSESVLREVEYVYREAVSAWLRGEPQGDYGDEGIEAKLREAIDPWPIDRE